MQPLDLSKLRPATRSTATSTSFQEQRPASARTPRGTPRGTHLTATPALSASTQYHDDAAVNFFGLSALAPIPGWKRCAALVTVRTATTATQHVAQDALTPTVADADTHAASGNLVNTLTKTEAALHASGELSPSLPTPCGHSRGSRGPTAAGHPVRSRSASGAALFAQPTSGRGQWSGGPDPAHRLARTGSGMSSVRSGHLARARSPASSVASYSTRTSMRRRGSAATGSKYNAEADNHHEDMTALHHHDLHTTLWMATQEGPIEVRDAANPAYLMAVVEMHKGAVAGAAASTPRRLGAPLPSLAAGLSADRRFVTALQQIGGNRVVAGLSDGMLLVYDASTLTEVTQLRAHNNAITCMTVTTMPTAPSGDDNALTYPRASVLLTGSSDCTIAKWDGVTLECLGRLRGNRRGVSALAATDGGCFAFSGSEDGAVRCWSLLGNEEVAFTPEEQQLLRKQGTATPRTARGSRARRQSSAYTHLSSEATTEPQRGPETLSDPTRRLFDQKAASRRGSRRASMKANDPFPEDEEAFFLRTASTSDARPYGLLAGGGTDISPVRQRQPVTDSADDALSEEHGAKALKGGKGARHGITLQKVGIRSDRKPVALLPFVEGLFQTFRTFAPVTAASSALAIEHVASYDDPTQVRWPIQSVHKERVSGLAVLQDRLLVSACRDGTAMVFALPSGEPVGALPLARNIPLTGVVIDPNLCRVLVGFTDGSVAGFDLRNAQMPRVFEVRPPAICFSSVFAPLQGQRMPRLAVLRHGPASETDEAPSQQDRGLVVVSTSHRTQVAHGPSQSYSSYRIGEPSLREIKLAMDVGHRQKQCLEAAHTRAVMKSNMTVEQMEAPDLHHCGCIMQKQHEHNLAQQRFRIWQRWMQRRRRLRDAGHLAEVQQWTHLSELRQRYLIRWCEWKRTRQQETHEQHVFILTHRGTRDDPARLLGLSTGPQGLACTIGENTRTAQRAMNVIVVGRVESVRNMQLRRRYFSQWLNGVCDVRVATRRELAFNRLLLSFHAQTDARLDSAAVVRRAVLCQAVKAQRVEKLVPVLLRGTEQRCDHLLRHRYFSTWQRFRVAAKQAEAAADLAGEWSLVEPLSAVLVQSDKIRQRYFMRWWAAARCISPLERRVQEQLILQDEWDGMSDVTRIPASREELLKEEVELQEAIRQCVNERERVTDEETVLQEKLNVLQREAALRVLTCSFQNVPITSFEESAMCPAPSSTTPRRRQSSTASRSSSIGGRPSRAGASRQDGAAANDSKHGAPASVGGATRAEDPTDDVDDAPDPQQDPHHALYTSLVAVLKALKGSVLQCARDDKQMSVAHQMTLSLPVQAPSNASGHARPARLGASVGSLSGSTPRSLSASVNAGRTGCGGSGSAASMWAAHPKEPVYENLAAAFDGVARRVVTELHAARTQLGPVVPRDATQRHPSTTPSPCFRDTSAVFADAPANDTAQVPSQQHASHATPPLFDGATGEVQKAPLPAELQWVRAVPSKTRKELLGHVLKLLALFDSFTAHSEWPVTVGAASFSTRGTSSLSQLPFTWLCSPSTATALTETAPDLLMLFNTSLWNRQHRVGAIHAPATQLPLGVGTTPAAQTHRRVDSISSSASAPSGAKPRVKTPVTPPLHLSAEALRRAAAAASTPSTAAASPKVRTTTAASQRPPAFGAKVSSASPTTTTHPRSAQLTNASSPHAGRGAGGSFSSVPRRSVEPAVPAQPADAGAGRAGVDRDVQDHFNCSYGSIPSGASTPRSSVLLTPRVSVAAGATTKPYLGFRVAVSRDAASVRPVIAIREVAAVYTTASGEQSVGPAVAAGLQAGDVLSRFAGYAVTDLAAFNTIVARHVRSGAEVPVVVMRQGQSIQSKITVGMRSA